MKLLPNNTAKNISIFNHADVKFFPNLKNIYYECDFAVNNPEKERDKKLLMMNTKYMPDKRHSKFFIDECEKNHKFIIERERHEIAPYLVIRQ
jgi:hypothetical protein